MPLPKLEIKIAQSAYAVSEPETAKTVVTQGGLPRQRLDFLDANVLINVQWELGPTKSEELVNFYYNDAKEGGAAFLIDLMLDTFEQTEYTAFIVPGSFSLDEVEGLTYRYSAKLEVAPAQINEDTDNAIMFVYESYSITGDGMFELLSELVNEDLPEATT